MKEKFIQYHVDEHMEDIFENAIIVLDTNSLLNFYRYNKENRDKYFEILTKIRERLILPYHVCEEFYKNRNNLIKNRSSFKDSISKLISESFANVLNKIESGSGNKEYDAALSILRNEDNLKKDIIENLKNSEDSILNIIEEFKDDITDKYVYEIDPILNNIVEIFDNKVSDKISGDDLKKIYKEGEERYKNEVPPGYKDNNKKFPDKFGDLIVWKEIIKIAYKYKKNILFISDDRKEDWVEKYKEKDLGARKELIREFNEETNKLFCSITTKEFIRKISNIYGVKDIELLEKETKIIEDQIRKEEYENNTNEEFCGNYNKNLKLYQDSQSHLIKASDMAKMIEDSYKWEIPKDILETRRIIDKWKKNFEIPEGAMQLILDLKKYEQINNHIDEKEE